MMAHHVCSSFATNRHRHIVRPAARNANARTLPLAHVRRRRPPSPLRADRRRRLVRRTSRVRTARTRTQRRARRSRSTRSRRRSARAAPSRSSAPRCRMGSRRDSCSSPRPSTSTPTRWASRACRSSRGSRNARTRASQSGCRAATPSSTSMRPGVCRRVESRRLVCAVFLGLDEDNQTSAGRRKNVC